MVARLWHGWTTPERADAYEQLLKTEVFPGIEAKNVAGYREIQLFRRALESGEVEFITIMWFDGWEAVKAFAGEAFEQAYVPPPARAILKRFDVHARHYEILERRVY